MYKNFQRPTPVPASIEFMGGAGGFVTGSCDILRSRDSNIGVDCGLFQGAREERSARGERWNYHPPRHFAQGLDPLIITHPHIDHTGRLPVLFRQGFTPEIITTETAATFLEPMLYNSAEIQENENPKHPLYEKKDVDRTLGHLRVVQPFDQVRVGQRHSGITAEMLPNGHVMGANSVFIRIAGKQLETGRNILFTGDMGKPQQSLCGGYGEYAANYPTDPVHALVVESTNFEKQPVSFAEKCEQLFGAIDSIWQRGGNPLFPTLSFHRFQELIEMFHNNQGGLIPADCRFVIDAPLGMELLGYFKEIGPEHLTRGYGDDPNFYRTVEESLKRFDLNNNVHVIGGHKESLQATGFYADYPGKAIILASGGMGQHGRSVNWLRGQFGLNPNNGVLFTSHQVEGTPGAQLLRKEAVTNPKPGKDGKVRRGAEVMLINGFTSHISGPDETFEFLEKFDLSELQTVMITHGREQARRKMAEEFKRRGFAANIILPEFRQTVEL